MAIWLVATCRSRRQKISLIPAGKFDWTSQNQQAKTSRACAFRHPDCSQMMLKMRTGCGILNADFRTMACNELVATDAAVLILMPRSLAMTKRSCLMLPCLAARSFTLSGCGEEQVGIPHTHHPAGRDNIVWPVRRSEGQRKCCRKGGTAAVCPNCGLHKGSILCCSTAFNGAPRDVILCRKCGEKAFTKNAVNRARRCVRNAACTKVRPVAVKSKRSQRMSAAMNSSMPHQGRTWLVEYRMK